MLNQWGEEQQNAGGNFLGRLAANTLSPGYIGADKTTSLETELQRLYDVTGDAGVLPNAAAKSIKFDGEAVKLDGLQYANFATKKGKLSKEIVGDIVSNRGYKGLTEKQKASAITNAYSFATAVAKNAVSTYKLSDSEKEIVALQRQGVPYAAYMVAHQAQSSIKSDKDYKGNAIYLSAARKKKAAVDRATQSMTLDKRKLLYKALDISAEVWDE